MYLVCSYLIVALTVLWFAKCMLKSDQQIPTKGNLKMLLFHCLWIVFHADLKCHKIQKLPKLKSCVEQLPVIWVCQTASATPHTPDRRYRIQACSKLGFHWKKVTITTKFTNVPKTNNGSLPTRNLDLSWNSKEATLFYQSWHWESPLCSWMKMYIWQRLAIHSQHFRSQWRKSRNPNG